VARRRAWTCSIALAALIVSTSTVGASNQTEMVLEVNYRINVLPWFYVQPDIQVIIDPGAAGKIDDALVLAMQFGVPF